MGQSNLVKCWWSRARSGMNRQVCLGFWVLKCTVFRVGADTLFRVNLWLQLPDDDISQTFKNDPELVASKQQLAERLLEHDRSLFKKSKSVRCYVFQPSISGQCFYDLISFRICELILGYANSVYSSSSNVIQGVPTESLTDMWLRLSRPALSLSGMQTLTSVFIFPKDTD